MDWLKIIEVLLPLIVGCIDKSGRSAVRSDIATSSGRARRATRRAAKKVTIEDHGRKYWRENKSSILDEADAQLAALTDAEIDDILDEAEEDD